MKIESQGRGLQITIEEGDLQAFKAMLDHQIDRGFVLAEPAWVWQLDAALVAKINDNRGEGGL